MFIRPHFSVACISLFFFFWSWTGFVVADVALILKTSSDTRENIETSIFQIKGSQLRYSTTFSMEDPSLSNQDYFIYKRTTDNILFIQPSLSTYYMLSKDINSGVEKELSLQKKKITSMIEGENDVKFSDKVKKNLSVALANISNAQQQLGLYQSQLKAIEPRILSQTGTTHFDGYECTIYKVSIANNLSDVCYVSYNKLNLSEAEAHTLSAFFNRYRSSTGVSLVQGLVPGSFPVLMVSGTSPSNAVSSKLEKLDFNRISSELFVIPDNYVSRN